MEKRIISMIGPEQPSLLPTICRHIAQWDCNIDDSRITGVGGEAAILMAISGTSEAVQTLDAHLPKQLQQLNMVARIKPFNASTSEQQEQYTIFIQTMDHPGLIRDITQYLTDHDVSIQEANTKVTHAPHTGTPFFELELTSQGLIESQFDAFNHQFSQFCESRNLDMTIVRS